MEAGGIPHSVTAVLAQAPEWRDAQLLEALFDSETALPGQGRPSQTDLLGIAVLKEGNAIRGVEGRPISPLPDWSCMVEPDREGYGMAFKDGTTVSGWGVIRNAPWQARCLKVLTARSAPPT
jgi:hypothetical protein